MEDGTAETSAYRALTPPEFLNADDGKEVRDLVRCDETVKLTL